MIYSDESLTLNTDFIVAIQADKTDPSGHTYTVVLNVFTSASGQDNNYDGPFKISVNRFQRNSIVQLMKSESSK